MDLGQEQEGDWDEIRLKRNVSPLGVLVHYISYPLLTSHPLYYAARRLAMHATHLELMDPL